MGTVPQKMEGLCIHHLALHKRSSVSQPVPSEAIARTQRCSKA